MATKTVTNGAVHTVPADLKKALLSSSDALDKWETLTPLARNEWICWTISVKLQKTREEHVKRVIEDLKKGKRRPCCWIGCIHRQDKSISKSVQGILSKRLGVKK